MASAAATPADIGAALGVSKQAAHERFVAAPLAWPTNFNEPARQVVALAVSEARGFGHRYLGTGHSANTSTASAKGKLRSQNRINPREPREEVTCSLFVCI